MFKFFTFYILHLKFNLNNDLLLFIHQCILYSVHSLISFRTFHPQTFYSESFDTFTFLVLFSHVFVISLCYKKGFQPEFRFAFCVLPQVKSTGVTKYRNYFRSNFANIYSSCLITLMKMLRHRISQTSVSQTSKTNLTIPDSHTQKTVE